MTRLHVYALLLIGLLVTIPWPVVPDAEHWFGVPAWAVVAFAGIVLFGAGLFVLIGGAWATVEEEEGADA